MPVNEIREAWGETVDRTEFLYDDPSFAAYGLSATTIDDRRNGKFYPIYQTETELAVLRMQARALCQITRIHDGAIDALANYTFGNGFGFEANCELETATDLVAELQRCIDEFCETNMFAGDLDREIHKRSREDGETFVQLRRDRNGVIRAKILEPDQVTEPGNSNQVEQYEDLCNADDPPLDWTFGIATEKDDSACVVGYYVQNDAGGTDWDFLRPERLEHFKRNVTRAAKRGVTDFYGIFADLANEAKLRRNSAIGAAVQAAIAWIVQHAPGVTQSQATTIGSTAAVGTVSQHSQTGATRLRNALRNPAGTVLHVESGRQFLPGPMGAERNAGFTEIAGYVLRAIGQRWNAPEYLISGDASNANYASSLVAESPFVKARQADQQWYGQRFTSLLWKVIAMHWQRGRFDRWAVSMDRIRHWCDITVNYPTVESRDPQKIAQTQEVLQSLGVISPKTIATQHGLDLDEEIAQGAKKPEPPPQPMGFGGPPGAPGMPGFPGQNLAMQQQQSQQQQPPAKDNPALQSAIAAALESVETSGEARAILEQLTESDGKWITTDSGKRIQIDGEGNILKGGSGKLGNGATFGSKSKKTASSKKMKKLTITQADKELRKKGYSIEKAEGYDLKTKTANYRVKGPDGKSLTMTASEIKAIISE